MVDYVVYLALILTYSSLRSQVQTRSSPWPRPRSIVISYSRPPMISRMRSRRTPSRSMPRSTSRSPPKAMATLSCSTRAGDLPRAIMIRPQFGSAPLSAVFTSGEFATLRAASSASRRLAAPRTAIATSFVAPSPSATSARASRCISASRPAANCASPRPRSRGRFSASPFARTATVSLVDWSASTVMQLKDRSTVRRTTAVSAAGATTASVAAKQNMVARWGSIMPTPFAIPPIVTARPSTSSRSAASFGFASVVRIASAAARPPWGESDLASFGSAARTLSIGSGTPMTPVDAIALGVHRWRLESRALGPTEHDVEVLDAVGRAPFAEVVDRRQAHGATGPRIGDHRDVAVVRADDPARRRPLALVKHAHERLAGVGLAVDAEELGRRECRGEGHGGGGEKPAGEGE